MSSIRLRVALAGGLALLVLLGWLALRGGGDASLKAAQPPGSLRIGYAIEAPYAYLTPAGEVTGQSPELAKRIAARLGVERIDWRLLEFSALLNELEEGRIDVIAAGMFITPERSGRVSFSEPVFHVRQGLLVAAGNPRGLHAYADALGRPEIKLAALTGAVEAAMLRRLGLAESQLVLVPDAQTGLEAVEAGVADGLALSSPSIYGMAQEERLGRTEAARPFAQPAPELGGKTGYGAFAFRKADRALREAWNTAQQGYLSSQEYGALMERFGFSPDELPGGVSTAEILRP